MVPLLKPGPVAPDIFLEVPHVVLQGQIHGGVLNGQSAGLGQGIDEHYQIIGIIALDAAAETHDADDLVLDLNGDHQHGKNPFFAHRIPVL